MYYPLSASLSLFANLIRNPEDQNASGDLSLMQLVLGFLSKVMTSDKSIAASRTFCIFQELHRTAAAHVSKAVAQALPREKRKRVSDEQSDQITNDIGSRPGPVVTNTIDPGTMELPQPLQPSAAQITQSSNTAPSSRASADRNIALPENIPDMGLSSFEWEMMNLWGLSEEDQGPYH